MALEYDYIFTESLRYVSCLLRAEKYKKISTISLSEFLYSNILEINFEWGDILLNSGKSQDFLRPWTPMQK